MFKRSLSLIAVVLFAAAASLAQGTGASPSPSPEKAKTSTFRPTKAQITEGQTKLKDAKLYSGAVDGKYNDDTRAAIKSYQKSNGLPENGKFDKATLEKMGIALTDSQKGFTAPGDVAGMKVADKPKATSDKPTTDGPKRPAPFSANKDQIMALQKVLIEGKMFAGAADGERSDALKDAVKKYQEANKLNATGGINAATLEKAGIALTDKQKEQVAAQAAYDAAKVKTN